MFKRIRAVIDRQREKSSEVFLLLRALRERRNKRGIILDRRMEFINAEPRVASLWLYLVDHLHEKMLKEWLRTDVERVVSDLLYQSTPQVLDRAYRSLILGRTAGVRLETFDESPRDGRIAFIREDPARFKLWSELTFRLHCGVLRFWSRSQVELLVSDLMWMSLPLSGSRTPARPSMPADTRPVKLHVA